MGLNGAMLHRVTVALKRAGYTSLGITWIADVKLGTGADVKAHCVDLKPASAKTTTAKKASDKKPADKAALAVAKPKPPAAATAPPEAAAEAVPPKAPPVAAPLAVTPATVPAAAPAAGSTPAPY